MKKIILSTILAVLILPAVLGQSDKKPMIRATSFGFNFGFAGVSTANTNEDYNNLVGATNSSDLFKFCKINFF